MFKTDFNENLGNPFTMDFPLYQDSPCYACHKNTSLKAQEKVMKRISMNNREIRLQRISKKKVGNPFKTDFNQNLGNPFTSDFPLY